jgi:hypothetical protein
MNRSYDLTLGEKKVCFLYSVCVCVCVCIQVWVGGEVWVREKEMWEEREHTCLGGGSLNELKICT